MTTVVFDGASLAADSQITSSWKSVVMKWGDKVDTVLVSTVDRLITKSLATGTAFSCASADAS